ncbi:DUF4129 domain-containing protein [Hymenobacter sp. CA2-7]|nr:DUF4129 domain-containing protein [Hymenobacter sp. CA2-7]
MNTRFLTRTTGQWLLLGCLALGGGVAAQPAPAPATQAPAVRLRQPPAVVARLRELAGERAFDYQQEPPADDARASAWQRFWRRVFRWLRELFGGRDAPTYNGFWCWVIYGLLAAAAGWVVLKLLQVDLTWAFGRAPRRAPLAYETLGENIHELDFEEELRAAEEAGNRRLAVRLGYLALLKQLSDRDLIAWQPDKTNHAYLGELASQRPALRPPFAELTRQFEYVWYGELPLTPAQYTEVRAAQVSLSKTLTD